MRTAQCGVTLYASYDCFADILWFSSTPVRCWEVKHGTRKTHTTYATETRYEQDHTEYKVTTQRTTALEQRATPLIMFMAQRAQRFLCRAHSVCPCFYESSSHNTSDLSSLLSYCRCRLVAAACLAMVQSCEGLVVLQQNTNR